MSAQTWNYYEVLEVAPDATQDKIYQAYVHARETYSLSNPNLFQVFSETEALDWINVIEEAYSVIGHPNTRRNYDTEISSKGLNKGSTLSLVPTEGLTPSMPLRGLDKNSNEAVTAGHSTTAFSQYKVNNQVEDQIKNQEIFDGLFLKKIREYKNIDLTEFSKITCIAIRHLYAIENNNFSVLPAPVFVRGYVIQYCRVLGLPEDKVVTSFMSLLKNG